MVSTLKSCAPSGSKRPSPDSPQAPFNAVTGHRYSGINVLILSISVLAYSTQDPRWCSFLQAKQKGWNVKAGSKATTIFFTRKLVIEEVLKGGDKPDKESKTVSMLRHYSIFHASQLDGIPPYQ